jgi:hypothetical protein
MSTLTASAVSLADFLEVVASANGAIGVHAILAANGGIAAHRELGCDFKEQLNRIATYEDRHAQGDAETTLGGARTLPDREVVDQDATEREPLGKKAGGRESPETGRGMGIDTRGNSFRISNFWAFTSFTMALPAPALGNAYFFLDFFSVFAGSAFFASAALAFFSDALAPFPSLPVSAALVSS